MAKQSRIITESTADLPGNLINQHNITVIPMSVEIEGETFVDGVTITPTELYHRMRTEKISPKTAQVTPAQYIECFEKVLKAGEAPVYIGFSSVLSGSFQSSQVAAATFPAGAVSVVDTKCASLGEGLIVLEAAKMAEAGLTPAEITEQIAAKAKTLQHLVVVDTLEYLARGGRISNAKAIVGNILNLKPLIHVVDGALIPFENARTRKKALKRLIELMQERGQDLTDQTIGISHADNLETAEELRQMIAEQFGVTRFVISTIGATIGSHTGPGTVALFFLGTPPMTD